MPSSTPSSSSSPATLVAIAIALAALSIALFHAMPSTLVTVARPPPLSHSPSPSSLSLSLAFIAASIAVAAVTLPLSVTRHPRRRRHRPRYRRCHRPRRRPSPSSPSPLPPSPSPSSSPATHVAVAIAVALALAALTLFFTLFAIARPPPSSPLFVAALIIRRALSLFVVPCRPAHVHRPTLTLPSLVDCCFFTPPADGGGGWGHHLPLLFSGLAQLPLVVALKMSHRGCGVVATAMAIPALPSGQIWPSPARGMCTSGATPRRGGRAGMVSFGAISVVSAMVVRVIWRVARLTCCRVYVKSGTNV